MGAATGHSGLHLTAREIDAHDVDLELSLRRPVQDAHNSLAEHPPDHLVVMMHGVMGRSSHMSALGEAVNRRLSTAALVFSTSRFSRLNSLRGTRFAGNAVFAEIQEFVTQHKTSLKYISLCGYSFGGVVAMWVAARLYEHGFLGLKPLNLVTIACPHLGATEENGGGFVQTLRRQFIRGGGVQTGIELSHADPSALLLSLTHPSSAGYAGMKVAHRKSRSVVVRILPCSQIQTCALHHCSQRTHA